MHMLTCSVGLIVPHLAHLLTNQMVSIPHCGEGLIYPDIAVISIVASCETVSTIVEQTNMSGRERRIQQTLQQDAGAN